MCGFIKISDESRLMGTASKDRVFASVERILDNYLEMNNHRKTPERYTILKAVYSFGGHFTLEELGGKLATDYSFTVSRATLYNTLNLLMELRLVTRHRFQGTTKYEACYANSNHCHQICTICGKETEIKAQLLVNAVDNMKFNRFRKDGFTLYVYGVCSACQRKLTRENKQKKSKTE